MSFNLLQHRSRANTIRFYAFDLLIYRGRSTLLGLELSKRRELLCSGGCFAWRIYPDVGEL